MAAKETTVHAGVVILNRYKNNKITKKQLPKETSQPSTAAYFILPLHNLLMSEHSLMIQYLHGGKGARYDKGTEMGCPFVSLCRGITAAVSILSQSPPKLHELKGKPGSSCLVRKQKLATFQLDLSWMMM